MESDDSKISFFGKLEELSKLGFTFFGIVYATGFIVVALYLAKYSVSPLSLVRVQYILAGIWLLLPLASFIIIIVWIAAALRQQYEDKVELPTPRGRRIWFHSRRIVWGLCIVFGWILISFNLLKWLSYRFPSSANISWSFLSVLETVSIILVFSLGIGLCGLVSWLYLKDVNFSSFSGSYHDIVWGITNASFTLLVVLAYVGYFAFILYEKIPSELGGGAPVRVQFVLKKDSIDQNFVDFIKVTKEGRMSEQYLLLLSTDKTYVVINPNNQERAIEISKDLVDGIIYNVK